MPGCLSLFDRWLPRCYLPRKSRETATPPHGSPTISLHNTHNSGAIPSAPDGSRGNHSAKIFEDEGPPPRAYEVSPKGFSSRKAFPSGSPANSTDANASSADCKLPDTAKRVRQDGGHNHQYNVFGERVQKVVHGHYFEAKRDQNFPGILSLPTNERNK